MAKKKETKKKPQTKIHATWLPARGVAAELRAQLDAATNTGQALPQDPPIGSSEYDASFQVTDGLGKTSRATYLSGYWNEPIISSSEARQNRLYLYDGTAELLLKLKNNLDLLTWTNLGIITEGVGRGIRIEVKRGYATFYTKPFFSSPEKIGRVVIGRDMEEKILLRAGTSVPNRKVLKLLNEL